MRAGSNADIEGGPHEGAIPSGARSNGAIAGKQPLDQRQRRPRWPAENSSEGEVELRVFDDAFAIAGAPARGNFPDLEPAAVIVECGRHRLLVGHLPKLASMALSDGDLLPQLQGLPAQDSGEPGAAPPLSSKARDP